MRSAILLGLAVAVAVGACGHPTYGRPAPRDTVPTTKAPGTTEPKPNEKPTTKELNRRDPFPAESPASVCPYRTRTTTGTIHPGSSVLTSSLKSPRVRGVNSKSAVSPGPVRSQAGRARRCDVGKSAPSLASGRHAAARSRR